MSPKYTLVYFNLRARGELIRLLFHAAGASFVDKRVEFADWPALKPHGIKESLGTTIYEAHKRAISRNSYYTSTQKETPDGTLPYLCVDDKTFGESMPIARYVARLYNLFGKSDLDKLQADIILNYIEEIRNTISRARNDKMLTDEQKKELEARVATTLLPKLLVKMEKRLAESKSGYLIGDGLSIADLGIFDMLENPLKEHPNLLERFPKLSEHRKKIASYPRIAKYLSTRPETPL